jgi:myo-inositol-1(or 4)-monophosphatase
LQEHDAAINSGDLGLIELVVRQAGEIARRYYGGEYRRWSKDRGEPVTEADLAIDSFLRQELIGARPTYGWLSEEGGEKERGDARRLFIVDPIDGTTAFLKMRPHFSISVAIVESARPVVGVVYNPITDECFTAAKGAGSKCNGESIHASACASIEGCRMLGPKDLFAHAAWSNPPNTPWPEMQIENRNSIAYRMALVASGAFDAAITLSPKHDWDVAAGDLIVSEAGGRVTTHDGSEFVYGRAPAIQRSLVCAGPALHVLLLERLKHIDPTRR